MFDKDEMKMNESALESLEHGEDVGIGAKEDIENLVKSDVEIEQTEPEEIPVIPDPPSEGSHAPEKNEPKKLFSANMAEIPAGGKELFTALGWDDDNDDELEFMPKPKEKKPKKKKLSPKEKKELKAEKKAKKILDAEAKKKERKRESLEKKQHKKEIKDQKKKIKSEKKRKKKERKQNAGKEAQPKTNPKISILLYVYNPERKSFKALLSSINKQNYSNIRLYIVDDCSTAISKNDLDKFLQDNITQFPFELHQNEEHLGKDKTYEKLTSMATGDFVAYAAQDDIWHPGKIKRCIVEMERRPSSMVFSDVSMINEKGKFITASIVKLNRNIKYMSGYGLAGSILRKNFVILDAAFVRADVAKEAVPACPDMTFGHYLAFYCALRGRVAFIGRPLIRKRKYQVLPPGRVDEQPITTKDEYVELRISRPIEAMKWINSENIWKKAEKYVNAEQEAALAKKENEIDEAELSEEEKANIELMKAVDELVAEAEGIEAGKEDAEQNSEVEEPLEDWEEKMAKEKTETGKGDQNSEMDNLIVVEKTEQKNLPPDWNSLYGGFGDEIKDAMLWYLTRKKIFGSRKGVLKGMWARRHFGLRITIWELIISFLPESIFEKVVAKRINNYV